MNYVLEYAAGLPVALAVLALVVVFGAAAWVVRNLTTPQDDHAVLREGNVAVAIERGGFLLAHVVAMGFAIASFDRNAPWESVGLLAIKFALTSALLLALQPVVDRAVLPKIANNQLLLAGNTAVAVTMSMVNVALGVVAGAATVGWASTLWQTIASTVAFAVLGVVVVLAVTRAHLWVTHRRDGGPQRLVDGDLATALEMGSVVLGLGIIMSVGVAGDLVSWVDGLMAFVSTCLIGIAVLYSTQWLVNRAMTRGESGTSVRRAGNVAMVAVVAVGRVGMALVVALILARVL